MKPEKESDRVFHTIYLLINNNKTMPDGSPGLFRPFAEQFRLFSNKWQVIAEATKLGWEGCMDSFIGKVGIKNIYSCGDVDVAIIPLTPEDE